MVRLPAVGLRCYDLQGTKGMAMVVPFSEIPGRVFLDTNVVNFTLDFREQICDGGRWPLDLPARKRQDVDALHNIFLTGRRAMWQFVISPRTYEEVGRTSNPQRQSELCCWFFQLWHYWQTITDEVSDLPSPEEVADLRRRLLASGMFDILPQADDRALLCDAIVCRCDAFCTRDWKTILRYRRELERKFQILILTPTEWWSFIAPYARLWV